MISRRWPFGSRVRVDHYQRQQPWLWSRRHPIERTPAEHYLRQVRGYSGPIPQTLAFLPPSKPKHRAAMIAAYSLVDEPEPGILGTPRNNAAVHLTLLRADGSGKADVEHSKLRMPRIQDQSQ
jgi:hypothetical protein